ncbi:MAG: PEP-CTERM sorting domain-containing protein [Steroidobacteraceae bacterium]
MNVKKSFAVSLLLLSVWAVPFTAAHASSVLYDSASFIQGQQAGMQSFDITTPGTLTVTLSDIPWLDVVSDLTSFLTTANGVVGTSTGSGSESFSVGPGEIFAHWFGEASGTYDLGVIGIKIVFQAAGSATPVPLPASLLLLLSGLGVLFGWQHRQSPPAAA